MLGKNSEVHLITALYRCHTDVNTLSTHKQLLETQLDQSKVQFLTLGKVLLIKSWDFTETGHECGVTLVYQFAIMLAWTSGIHGLPNIVELIIIIGATDGLAFTWSG